MKYDAKDLSRLLAQRAEAVAHWLLPGGKRVGNEYEASNVNGGSGSSLKVHLIGDKAGVWCDFAAGGSSSSGDLLDLIVASKGVKLVKALAMARVFLHIKEPQSTFGERKWSKIAEPASAVLVRFVSPVCEYLTGQRALSFETLRAFRMKELMTGEGPGARAEIAFPYYSPNDELLAMKYLNVKRGPDGKKLIRKEGTGTPPSLFGWQAFPAKCREVVITEGEIDALTWAEVGFPALSVPQGASDRSWIDFEWENLQAFDKIFLSFDSDKAGMEAAEGVAKRLGRHRCFRVVLEGFKDANEALQHGCEREFFGKALLNAQPFVPAGIKRPIEFSDEIHEVANPTGNEPEGFIPDLLHNKVKFAPAAMTIWTGFSGHGKSIFLSELMLHAMLADQTVAIASMEMPGKITLWRMIRQALVKTSVTNEEIDQVLEWMTGKLWIFDLKGIVKTAEVLELMEYASARYGIDHFVVDSLMKIDLAGDDLDGQRAFSNELSAHAQLYDAHVHLVVHSRKKTDEFTSATKQDVKGSGDLTNQADNVMVIWRNKKKNNDDPHDHSADALVKCDKQRDTGVEGTFGFWFFADVMRYCKVGPVADPKIDPLLDFTPPPPPEPGPLEPPAPEPPPPFDL